MERRHEWSVRRVTQASSYGRQVLSDILAMSYIAFRICVRACSKEKPYDIYTISMSGNHKCGDTAEATSLEQTKGRSNVTRQVRHKLMLEQVSI